MKSLRGKWWQLVVSLCILAVMVTILGWVLYMPWSRTQQAMITGNVTPGPWISGLPTPTPTTRTTPTPTPSVTTIPNMPIKVYCEVTRVEAIDRRPQYDNTDYFIYATLLTQQSGLLYTRTKQVIRFQWVPGTTPIALGNTGDLRPGAILQLEGEMTPALLIHADQIVVLSGHVTVVEPTPIP
ncbi:hypothetical protein [Ktedonospora formicarum]|uniref:Uncharacterized protein n=1 Tax=Ktedonospora formicarum TaxID=2778364 RepID=A0A8J3I6W7_9CHLR|nr:hypothetical protein [Ktedonospora formicarum]GHO46549.1 hypothetical protein KSX_47120 [Ktedonospora formicarum]